MGNIRELSLVYTYIPVGVYYWTSDNELYTPTAWSNVNTTIQSKKIGIIVSDESHAVCVTEVYSNPTDNSTSGLPYELGDTSDADCLTAYSESEALLSFDGYALSKPIYDTMGYIQGVFSDKLYVASLGEVGLILNQDSVIEALGFSTYSKYGYEYSTTYNICSSNLEEINSSSVCLWWSYRGYITKTNGGLNISGPQTSPFSSTTSTTSSYIATLYVFLVCYKIP